MKRDKTKKPLQISKETLTSLDKDELRAAIAQGASCSICACGAFSEDMSRTCPA